VRHLRLDQLDALPHQRAVLVGSTVGSSANGTIQLRLIGGGHALRPFQASCTRSLAASTKGGCRSLALGDAPWIASITTRAVSRF
jgi:hypothetical protein